MSNRKIATAGTKMTHFTADGATTACGKPVVEVLDREVLEVRLWGTSAVLSGPACRKCERYLSWDERKAMDSFNAKHNGYTKGHDCTEACAEAAGYPAWRLA